MLHQSRYTCMLDDLDHYFMHVKEGIEILVKAINQDISKKSYGL